MSHRLVRLPRLRSSRLFPTGVRVLAMIFLVTVPPSSVTLAGNRLEVKANAVRTDCLDESERHQHGWVDLRPYYCRQTLDGGDYLTVLGALNIIDGSGTLKGDSMCNGIRGDLFVMLDEGRIGEWTGVGQDGGGFTDILARASWLWHSKLDNVSDLLHEGYHAYMSDVDDNEAQWWAATCSGYIVY